MKLSKSSRHAVSPILIAGLCFIVLGLAAVLFAARATAPEKNMTAGATPLPIGKVTLTGKFVCLKHKDASGPQTLECAYGLSADGTTYGLDFSPVGNGYQAIPFGESVTLTGTLAEAPRSGIYDIAGILTVSELTR